MRNRGISKTGVAGTRGVRGGECAAIESDPKRPDADIGDGRPCLDFSTEPKTETPGRFRWPRSGRRDDGIDA